MQVKQCNKRSVGWWTIWFCRNCIDRDTDLQYKSLKFPYADDINEGNAWKKKGTRLTYQQSFENRPSSSNLPNVRIQFLFKHFKGNIMRTCTK